MHKSVCTHVYIWNHKPIVCTCQYWLNFMKTIIVKIEKQSVCSCEFFWNTYYKCLSTGEIFMCLFYKNLLHKNLMLALGKFWKHTRELVKQRHEPFIKEHTSSSEKRINNKNTRKEDNSFYTISISCTDLCNKCLRFLEHLGVNGTKKAGKIKSIK